MTARLNIAGEQAGRADPDQVTLFDSVDFATEDSEFI